MQPEQARHIAQLQRSAAELGQLTRDLAAAAAQPVEGSDPTGWVYVMLGPDGIPTRIRVRDGWQQRVDQTQLGNAVIDANRDAVQRAMLAWTVAVQDSDVGRQPDFETDTGASPAPSGQTPPLGHIRDVNELAEEALSKLHAAQTSQTPVSALDEGHDDGRHVTIQIASDGLGACTIEPAWARTRSGSTITAALSTALHRAVANRSAQSSSRVEVDALLGDALATLASLTATPPEQGGNR